MEHKLSHDELVFILERIEVRIEDQRNRVASLDMADPQLTGQHAVLRTLSSLSRRLRAFRDAALADRPTTHSTVAAHRGAAAGKGKRGDAQRKLSAR
jgi:hypothetical protein